MSSDVSQISTAWVDHNVKPMDSGFQYDALSQETSFRLLKLLPASDTSSPIICTMSEERMDDSSLKYAALSYTWGSTQDTEEIILNGRPALVTQNLHMALQHLRHVTGLLGNILKPLPFWIDALSINQQDETEKAMQIGHMYQIFANARPVVAWLGPERDGSDTIMKAIKQSDSVDVASISGPALLSFLNRPWWTRAWVLQECMAADLLTWLVCGSSCNLLLMVFPFVNKVLMYIDRQSYYIQRTTLREVLSYRWHFFMQREKYGKEHVFTLYNIIKVSSNLEATDSRDKIFALLGLVDDQTRSQIRPDYTLSPCEVFCKAIRVMAQDKEMSAKVLEKLGFLDRSIHRPLVENVYERQKCDGVACTSKSLCFDLPGWVSGTVSDLVGAFVMGLQDPKKD